MDYVAYWVVGELEIGLRGWVSRFRGRKSIKLNELFGWFS